MTTRMIVVHGGVGESLDKLDGCISAAEAGMDRLLKGEEALAGEVAATVVFENDPRFSCGTGSWPGMDLETIEMDASVMDSRGRLASTACIQWVNNPILVARLRRHPHRQYSFTAESTNSLSSQPRLIKVSIREELSRH